MPGQPSSRLLAIMVVVANLVICGGVVALTRASHRPAAAPETTVDTPTTETTTNPGTTTETTTGEPDLLQGFEQITGPGGMTTHIPAGWPTRTAKGEGSMQADDPAGTTRFLRYGGATTTLTDSYDLHADYERTFSADKNAYVSLRLARTEVRGLPAIDWEFEYDAPSGPRHVRSVYWLSGGYEYFVYASAPTALWPDTQPILDVMLTYSTP